MFFNKKNLTPPAKFAINKDRKNGAWSQPYINLQVRRLLLPNYLIVGRWERKDQEYRVMESEL
tara:strand:- start:447 stop:635 length:189 start_codon:yes stop_codon:yes gene_type:complete